jgi:hypothetical protein
MTPRDNGNLAFPRRPRRFTHGIPSRNVSGEAIGTQLAIAGKISERGGDDLPALKANRSAALEDVAQFFAPPSAGSVESLRESEGEGEHDRI